MLLCSLLVIASANDYNYDSSKNQAYGYGTKPEGETKTDYDTKPTPKAEEKHEYDTKPEGETKPDYDTKPTPKAEEKLEYGTKPDVYKPQPEDKEKPETKEMEKPDYGTKQVYQPNSEKPDYDIKKNMYKPLPEEKEKPESEEEDKPADYGDKPDLYKPQPEENKKTESSEEVEKPNYSPNPDFYNSNSEEKERSSYDNNPYVPEVDEKTDHYVKELPDFYSPTPEVLPSSVQGLIFCKSGPQGYYPIQGALARKTCLSVDENGYEKSFSVYSEKIDAKGYFFATLSPFGLYDQLTQLRDCKAFLESSPVGNCNVPVDVNKGISGAPLSDFRVLDQKRMKLYSVGPFFFCSEPNSVPSVPHGY